MPIECLTSAVCGSVVERMVTLTVGLAWLTATLAGLYGLVRTWPAWLA